MPATTCDRHEIYRQMLSALLLDQYRQLHRVCRDGAGERAGSFGDSVAAYIAGHRRLLDTLTCANDGRDTPLCGEVARVIVGALGNAEELVRGDERVRAIELSTQIFDLVSLAVRWCEQRPKA